MGWRKETIFDITDEFHAPTRAQAMQLLAHKPKPKIFPIISYTLHYKARDGRVVEAEVSGPHFLFFSFFAKTC